MYRVELQASSEIILGCITYKFVREIVIQPILSYK